MQYATHWRCPLTANAKQLALELARSIEVLYIQCLKFEPFREYPPLHSELMQGLQMARDSATRFIDLVKEK